MTSMVCACSKEQNARGTILPCGRGSKAYVVSPLQTRGQFFTSCTATLAGTSKGKVTRSYINSVVP